MPQATLILNPNAGRAANFSSIEPALVNTLAAHGFQAQIQHTTPHPDSARTLAHQASTTSDLVIACGGDGTVHGVLQGLAGTDTCLGVLPFGTANALARNLRLPLNPPDALTKVLTYTPTQIPLGCAETATGKRYFTVMAGAGPDGTLIHEMQLATKATTGRRAYYTEAARLFLTRRFPAFEVQYRRVDTQTWQTTTACAIMASRVPNLGGLFRGLTSASRLHHPHLLVHLLAAPAHLAFPAWFAFSKAGLSRANPWLQTIEAEEFRCIPVNPAHPVHSQVDGEATGPLPLAARIIPAALRLLMP